MRTFLKKALEILVTAGMPVIVYYILFDPYSMVNMDIFNYVSSIPNSTLANVYVKNVFQLFEHQIRKPLEVELRYYHFLHDLNNPS